MTQQVSKTPPANRVRRPRESGGSGQMTEIVDSAGMTGRASASRRGNSFPALKARIQPYPGPMNSGSSRRLSSGRPKAGPVGYVRNDDFRSQNDPFRNLLDLDEK
jgi:hypothetical protein